MELFRIANGPWEKLFSGKFQQHEVELYSNPEKILMVLVFEKKLDRVEGAIVELYKVMHATGDAEAFVETLPREALVITKHDESQTMKFLLLGSKPAYVRWTEDDFTREVDSLVKRLSTSATLTKDVSKAYELTLEEISEANESVQSAFFAQPMLTPLLATASHTTAEDIGDKVVKSVTKGEVIIGLTRDRQKVVEPLALFMRTIVTDGEPKDRKRVLQVIIEGALLSSTPAIIFDRDNSYQKMAQGSRNSAELQKYMVDLDPIGFPVKILTPGESVVVDLNTLSTEGFAEILGVGEKDFARILKMVLAKGKVKSTAELIEAIANTRQTEEFSEFQIQKTARIMKLAEIIYPNIFGGENNVEDMVKGSSANIARATVIRVDSVDEKAAALIAHSILRSLSAFVKGMEGRNVKAIAVIPEAGKILPNEKELIVSREISEMLREFQKNGLAFAVSAGSMIDLRADLRKECETNLSIVSGNDVSVQMKNRKGYRVLVRPTLSVE